MPLTEQVRKKLSDLPHKPGIYLMKGRFGTVIHVGGILASASANIFTKRFYTIASRQ